MDGSTEPRAAVTLQAVADQAGVSLKTASRAINGEQYVRQETRDRVLDAAALLGFQLNTMASLLARGITSNTVGLVTGDLANPFYAALAKGVEDEIRGKGLQLTLASSDESADTERALVQELAHRQVKAIIVVSAMDAHGEYRSLQERGIPVVFVDRAAADIAADSVVFDNRGGSRTAAAHLLGVGHRRVAFLGDYEWLPTYRERLAGFAEAMDGSGVDDWRTLVRDGAHDVTTACALTEALLDLPHPPTAVFASNNRATIGALQAFGRRRLSPQPALIGFDDFDLAEFIGVTVVANDPVEMGRRAASLALAHLASRGIEPETYVLPATLIVRGSGERPPV
ncbi:LacI family DNA-binding transcriptional regulator [Plantibacter sp. Mn2098]|uniref:LacI family DNA-binding transcriptional regulator n=1 Tax=Plantibacter sp. Mn2098 TaxID=3395266 RepID=UPI003BDEC479